MQVAERVLAGSHAVQEVAPCLPVIGPAHEAGPSRNRIGRVRPQAMPHLAQGEAPLAILMKDAGGCQRPQKPIERLRMRAGRGGELVAAARRVAQMIGDAEDHGDMDRLGDLVAIDQAHEFDNRIPFTHVRISPKAGSGRELRPATGPQQIFDPKCRVLQPSLSNKPRGVPRIDGRQVDRR